MKERKGNESKCGGETENGGAQMKLGRVKRDSADRGIAQLSGDQKLTEFK